MRSLLRLRGDSSSAEQTKQQKIKAQEIVGEDGAERWAAAKGYEPIMTRANKGGIPQGFDQVHKTTAGEIILIEAKGGRSMPSAGFEADPIGHTIRQADYLLKSEKSSAAQKEAAMLVKKAFAERNLVVQVISTKSAGAVPTLFLAEARLVPVSRVSKIARAAGKFGKLAGKAAAPVAIIITTVEVVMLGVEVADIVSDPDIGEQNKVTKVTQKIVGFLPAQVPFFGEKLEKASADWVEDYNSELSKDICKQRN
jgi:hypothetical protein